MNRFQQQHEEEVDRLTREKETEVLRLNQEQEEVATEMKATFDDLGQRYDKDKSALINEVALVQRERDELLVLAENEKQEVLHIAANEKALMSEKANKLNEDLAGLKTELDVLKRDSFSKGEQDKVRIVFWFLPLKLYYFCFSKCLKLC